MPNPHSRKRRRLEEAANVSKKTRGAESGGRASTNANELTLVKFLNQIFSENKSHAHRVAAVQVLGEELRFIPEDEVHTQALGWIGHIMKTIDACKVSCATELALCCHTLSQLLVMCSSSTELSRTVSISIVPKLLPSLLGIEPAEQEIALVAVVHLMKICLKYFGGSCLSFKNKLETYVMKLALAETLNSDSLLLKTCLSALASLPNCGGHGPTGNKHSEMWCNQLCRLLEAIEELIDCLYAVCGRVNRDGPKAEIPGQRFPTVSGDTSVSGLTKAATYLRVYLQAVLAMIDTPFSWRVRVPIKHLLSTICNLSSITPDSVIFRKRATRLDLEVVFSHLPSLHCIANDLLVALGNLCGSCLYSYTTTICQFVSSQLHWTLDMGTSDGETNYAMSRVNALNAVHSLLSQPGLPSILGTIAGTLVEHALTDISPSGTFQTEKMQLSSSIPKPPCQTPSITVSLRTDISKRLSALKLLGYLLSFLSGFLSTKQLKIIYDTLVALTLCAQSPLATECYAKDAQLRGALYETLLASIHSYNREVGPLTHIAIQLLRNGLLDRCPSVRSLCNNGLLVCQLVVEPRAPPLVQNPSAQPLEPPAKITNTKVEVEEQASQVVPSVPAVTIPPVSTGVLLTDSVNQEPASPESMSATDYSNDSIIVHAAESCAVSSAPSPEPNGSSLPSQLISASKKVESPFTLADEAPAVSSPNKASTSLPGAATTTNAVGSSPSVLVAATSSTDSVSSSVTHANDPVPSNATMDTQGSEVTTAAPQQMEEEPLSTDLADMINTFVTEGPDE